MGKLVELSSHGASVFFESSEVEESGVQQASGYMEKDFDKIVERVRPFCEIIIDNFQSLSVKPHSTSVEFGLSVSAEGNLFFVKASR